MSIMQKRSTGVEREKPEATNLVVDTPRVLETLICMMRPLGVQYNWRFEKFEIQIRC